MSDIDLDGWFDSVDDISDTLDGIGNTIMNMTFDSNTFQPKTQKNMSAAPRGRKTSNLSSSAKKSPRASAPSKKFDNIHEHDEPVVETPKPPKKKEMVVHEYRELHPKKGSFETPKSI